jgi:hypothetical protein
MHQHIHKINEKTRNIKIHIDKQLNPWRISIKITSFNNFEKNGHDRKNKEDTQYKMGNAGYTGIDGRCRYFFFSRVQVDNGQG